MRNKRTQPRAHALQVRRVLLVEVGRGITVRRTVEQATEK